MKSVTVVDSGTGNLFSLTEAFRRAGTTVQVAKDHADVRQARCLALPGVASFGAVARGIRGLRRAIEDSVEDHVPLLGICAGMQVMFESSDEGPGEGLGLFPGKVEAIRAEIVPHMGWSPIRTRQDPWLRGLTPGAMVYYAHSYAASADSPGTVATSEYGGPFAAAVHRDSIFGVQFHPEKSGPVGRLVLQNFLSEAGCSPS